MENRSDSLELECHVSVYIGLCSSSVRSSNTSAPLCFRPGVMAVGVVQIWSQVLLTLNTVKQWRQTYSPTASVSSRFGYTQDLVGGCNWPIVQLPHRHLQQTSIGCTHHNAKTGHTGHWPPVEASSSADVIRIPGKYLISVYMSGPLFPKERAKSVECTERCANAL